MKFKTTITALFSVVLCLLFLLPPEALSQLQNMPQVSPKASVSQRIGMTDVTVTYFRPGVKDREIWGKLVPFNDGNPTPWRAGANDNTTITFTNDVEIEGQPLAAGTYGLHMIPSAGDWIIIFSKNSTSMGSYYYKPEEDALRVTVTPVSAPHEEWLRFGFDDLTPNSALAFLHWEKLKAGFTIKVAVHDIVLANIRNQLRSTAGFYYIGWMQAANYCLRNDVNLEEGLTWIDQSINRDENFANLRLKSNILTKLGRTSESDAVMKKALSIAKENQLNQYGFQLLNENKVDAALDIFKMNVKRNPESWNVYDSLGEGYQKKGNTTEALKQFKTALKKAPVDQKARLEEKIKKLDTKTGF